MRTHSADSLPDLLLARVERPVCESLAAWLPIWRAAMATHGHHGGFTAAVAATLQADRMAWAFFSGYQGALHAAFASDDPVAAFGVAAFGANEATRKLSAIETALVEADGELRLIGHKSWVLTDPNALDLYVLARSAGGPALGPGSLSVARVRRDASGVEVEAPQPQSVVPELVHASIAFRNVRLDRSQVLVGDGYSTYARPFRLREDVFVTGCTLAFLLAQAHAAGWPTRWRQRCMAVIAALAQCAGRPPSAPSTELLTAGALALAGEVIESAEPFWTACAPPAAERWSRDKPILDLGKEARRKRALAAWARTGELGPPPGVGG